MGVCLKIFDKLPTKTYSYDNVRAKDKWLEHFDKKFEIALWACH